MAQENYNPERNALPPGDSSPEMHSDPKPAGEQIYSNDDRYYNAAREEQEQDAHVRAYREKRAREEKEAEAEDAEKDYRRQLKESREDAEDRAAKRALEERAEREAREAEREQEILKRHQEERERRAEAREQQRQKTLPVPAKRVVLGPEMDAHVQEREKQTKREKERKIAGDMFGFEPFASPNRSRKERDAEIKRSVDETKFKQSVEDFMRPKTAEEMTGRMWPTFGEMFGQRSRGAAKRAVQATRFHWNRSLHDSIRVPFGLTDPNTGMRAVRRQGVGPGKQGFRTSHPVMFHMLGGKGYSFVMGSGRAPRGILSSVGTMQSRRSMLLFAETPKRSVKRATKKAMKRRRVSGRPARFLDRMLYF